MNSQQIDAELDSVALKQAVWKNGKLLAACLCIARYALEHPVFWPDEIAFDFLGADDANVIGIAWRMCIRNLVIVEKTGHFKRSEAEHAKGRMVFQYRLINDSLARAFLRRHNQSYEQLTTPQLSLDI